MAAAFSLTISIVGLPLVHGQHTVVQVHVHYMYHLMIPPAFANTTYPRDFFVNETLRIFILRRRSNELTNKQS